MLQYLIIQLVNFNFFHLHSNNLTYINEIDSDKGKKVNDFKSYQNLLKNKNIILDQEKRKNLIKKKLIIFVILENYKINLMKN